MNTFSFYEKYINRLDFLNNVNYNEHMLAKTYKIAMPLMKKDGFKVKISNNNPLLVDLGVKFKDTIIRMCANERNIDKPIYYLVLLEFDMLDAFLKTKLTDDLSGYLPTCINSQYGFERNVKIKTREILYLSDWDVKYPHISIEIF